MPTDFYEATYTYSAGNPEFVKMTTSKNFFDEWLDALLRSQIIKENYIDYPLIRGNGNPIAKKTKKKTIDEEFAESF